MLEYTKSDNLSFCELETAIPLLFLHISAIPVAPPLVAFRSTNLPLAAQFHMMLLYSPPTNPPLGMCLQAISNVSLPSLPLDLALTQPNPFTLHFIAGRRSPAT
jgi:hypothetical protein